MLITWAIANVCAATLRSPKRSNNIRWGVRSLRAPVWVSHGDRDAVVPVRMGREVFAAAENKGELLVVRGAGHNDVPQVGGQAYWSWLVRAVESGESTSASATLGAAAERRSAP